MIINFRLMELSDCHRAFAIEKKHYFKPWSIKSFRYSVANYHAWVAVSPEKILLGYIICDSVLNEAQILNLSVCPDYLKMGVGQKLLSFLLDQFANINISKVFLECRKSNIVALNLYQKNGFKIIGTRKNYYTIESGFEDALILSHYVPKT